MGRNVDEIMERLGKKAERLGKKLGKTKVEIIRLILKDPSTNTAQMAKHIGVSTTAVDNHLRQMRDVFIRHVGPKKGGRWEILTD